jgi:hypothetical protein
MNFLGTGKASVWGVLFALHETSSYTAPQISTFNHGLILEDVVHISSAFVKDRVPFDRGKPPKRAVAWPG